MARTLDEIRAARPVVDRAKFRAATEADIARQAAEDDSAPAAPLSAFVKRRPGQRGVGSRPARRQVAIRFDAEALEAWRATGPGWQSRINDLVVREARTLTPLKDDGGEPAGTSTVNPTPEKRRA